MADSALNPRWKWGDRFFYIYLGILLVASYTVSDATPSRQTPDSFFWLAVPLTGYLAMYRLCTGTAPSRFKNINRQDSPALFWSSVSAFCFITVLLAFRALGIDLSLYF